MDLAQTAIWEMERSVPVYTVYNVFISTFSTLQTTITPRNVFIDVDECNSTTIIPRNVFIDVDECNSTTIIPRNVFIDVDECNSTTTNNCQQVCLNSPGSFMCACRDGYQTVTDNITNCEGIIRNVATRKTE